MTDFTPFLEQRRSLLIAPAGHGKTHAIVRCVSLLSDPRPALVLTHTHAGIASLRHKFTQEQVDPSRYNLETIMGFAARYVHILCKQGDITPQSDRGYFDNILKHALKLFSGTLIQALVERSYSAVIVDEYQDCSKKQHLLILALASRLPLHLLGDPLQGIFDFNGPAVDFDCDLTEFTRFDLLDKPLRWLRPGAEPRLGELILNIRRSLESYPSQPFANYPLGEECLSVINTPCSVLDPADDKVQLYTQLLRHNLPNADESDSVLILFPPRKDSGYSLTIQERAMLRVRLGLYGYTLLEALDDKGFYQAAVRLDKLLEMAVAGDNPDNLLRLLCEALPDLSLKRGELIKWFDLNNLRLIRRQGENAAKSAQLHTLWQGFLQTTTRLSLLKLLLFVQHDLGVGYLRAELFWSAIRCLRDYENCGSINDAMQQQRNVIRRQGRRVVGRCLGTTLLTKGLEFDIVVILDAQRFDTKNLYVALSRACRRLVVFTTGA